MFSVLVAGLPINDVEYSSTAYLNRLHVGKGSDHKFSLETNTRTNGTNLIWSPRGSERQRDAIKLLHTVASLENS